MILAINDNIISTDEIVGMKLFTKKNERLEIYFFGQVYGVLKNNQSFLDTKQRIVQEKNFIKNDFKNDFILVNPDNLKLRSTRKIKQKTKQQEINDLVDEYMNELYLIRDFISKYKDKPINDTNDKFPIFKTKYVKLLFLIK